MRETDRKRETERERDREREQSTEKRVTEKDDTHLFTHMFTYVLVSCIHKQVADMRAHWSSNGVEPTHYVGLQAFVGGSSGVREGVPVMTLADLVHPLALIKGRVIDYLDMDVQVDFDECQVFICHDARAQVSGLQWLL